MIIITLTIISALMSVYIIWKTDKWLSLDIHWLYYILVALLNGFSFCVVLYQFIPFAFLYHLSSYLFGIVYISFFVFIGIDVVSRLFRIKSISAAYMAIALSLFWSAYGIGNNLCGRSVERIELFSEKITTDKRIVFLTDIHVNRYHSSKYMQKIVDETNSLDPDLVLISGDFVNGATQASSIQPISDIKVPVFMVMGNHEVWQAKKVKKLLDASGVSLLDENSVLLDNITIIGLPFNRKENGLEQSMSRIAVDPSSYSVLLYHEPKDIDVAQEAGIDLMLSGHTHGGQLFPWNFITRLFYPYIKGLHKIKNMHLYISQGTGIWGPPLRLGSNNEVAVIELKQLSDWRL